jgi:hypothetical protein
MSLQGFYLTDKGRSNYNKFPLPNVSLGAGEFLVFWLDNDPEASAVHANFRLSGNEKHLYLFHDESQKPRLVDSLSWQTTLPDESVARVPDGGDVVLVTSLATPGTTNGGSSVLEMETSISCYPNPSSGKVYFSRTIEQLQVKDACGKELFRANQVRDLNLESLPNGIYFLQSNLDTFKLVLTH